MCEISPPTYEMRREANCYQRTTESDASEAGMVVKWQTRQKHHPPSDISACIRVHNPFRVQCNWHANTLECIDDGEDLKLEVEDAEPNRSALAVTGNAKAPRMAVRTEALGLAAEHQLGLKDRIRA